MECFSLMVKDGYRERAGAGESEAVLSMAGCRECISLKKAGCREFTMVSFCLVTFYREREDVMR